VTATPISNDTTDKVLACCNYMIGKRGHKDADYAKAPLYYDACWAWYQSLTPEQREIVSQVIDADAFSDRELVAKRIAAGLPSAPRCPF
jgi:hypothetical protein